MPLAPTPVDAAPDVPNSGTSESTFDMQYEAFNTWEATKLRPQINALAQNVFENATDVEDLAGLTQNYAVTAADAATVSMSAANFKNLWSNLSGALNKPACVKHNGRFWLLLNNLANVAASEPGPSNPDWTANDAGVVPSQTLNTAGASVAAVTGVRYILAANNIALTAPTPTLKGEYHGIRRVAGVTGCTWIFGSNKVRGATPGTLALDIQEQDLFYEDATQGYV